MKMRYILNKTVINDWEHSVAFDDTYRPWLMLLTNAWPIYKFPYEGSYSSTEELLKSAEKYNEDFNGLYDFVKSTLDDPAVRLFLEVMRFE